MKKAKKDIVDNNAEVKEEAVEEKAPSKKIKIGGIFWKLVFLAIVAGGGYYVWKNPQIVEKTKDAVLSVSRHEVEIVALREEISGLNAEIESLRGAISKNNSKVGSTVKDALSRVDEKYSAMEQYNMNIINSKADVALVLGVITRMDKAEERLDGMAKISDDGALILSTTMMIKDRAIKGDSFVMEAEILALLSEGKEKIGPAVEVIAASASGVDTDFALVNDFNIVYKELVDAKNKVVVDTWQGRVKAKLKELFKIKKRSAAEVEVKDHVAMAQAYVAEGKFLAAVREL
ncbi:MAG: hypothetical protein LBL47_00605, partial [Lactobacillus sp.]|nr:hypothetical protein [Lactobacillus sp.]